MKRLYENIEEINIKGSVSQLSEVITVMDISLQNIAEGTEQLARVLMKYSETNKGTQYERVVFKLISLREVLYQSSLELNDMQNEVVAYQNKVLRFEDMSETASASNPYLVERTSINVESTSVQFNRTEMMGIAAELRNYSEAIFYHVKKVIDSKNTIASIWQDSQYDTFAEFIDNVCKEIVEALKIFDDYVLYLEVKIKELS